MDFAQRNYRRSRGMFRPIAVAMIWFHRWRVETYDHLLARIEFEKQETLRDRCEAEDRIKALRGKLA